MTNTTNTKPLIATIIGNTSKLRKFIDKFGAQSFTYYPDVKKPELIHITRKVIRNIDEEAEEMVLVKGFESLRSHLLQLMYKFSDDEPIAYVERVLENNQFKESVILVNKGRNIFEEYKKTDAISDLFESGMLTVSRELKRYMSPVGGDSPKLLNYRTYETSSKAKNLVIEEMMPEVGWVIKIYDEKGQIEYDIHQDTLEEIKEVAFEEFGVPLDSWKRIR